MIEKSKNPISDEEGSILICAVRYAIGRQTYAPHEVIDYITPKLPRLSNKTLTVLFRDMNGFVRDGNLGDRTIDAPHCLEFFENIRKEMERRNLPKRQ